MSKITLEPNSSGAGTFSIVSPDSNTNRTLNLPDESGNILSNVSDIPGSNITGQFASSNMPAGSVIQVKQTVKDSTYVATTSGGPIQIPGFSVDITPSTTASKILIITHVSVDYDDGYNGLGWYVRRGTTRIIESSDLPANTRHGSGGGNLANDRHFRSESMTLLDNPSVTSQINYNIAIEDNSPSAGTFYLNRPSVSDSGNLRSVSTITVMEIL